MRDEERTEAEPSLDLAWVAPPPLNGGHGDTGDPPLDDLLDPYVTDRPPPPDRPWVFANMVAALDGTAATGGKVGALSSPTDRELFRRLRTLADVVLVGASTVRVERYGPFVTTAAEQQQRVGRGQHPHPTLAIVSRSLDIDWDLPCFRPADGGEPPLILTCGLAPVEAREQAAEHAEVIATGEEAVDLPRALRMLSDRGASSVLTEGGPTLLAQLVAVDCLDELCLTLSPVLGGDSGVPVARYGEEHDLVPFDLRHVIAEDGSLFLRYVRRLSRA